MKVEKVPFEIIETVWRNNLWQNRRSPIETHSAMKLHEGYDMDYFNNPASFIVIKDDDKIIGCLSGHMTAPYWYRSRGLWVSDEYRRQGIATLLMQELTSIARSENALWIWTLPRLSSLEFYQSQGFIRSSENINEGVEFGPNCFAIKPLC
jgi:GNAT superfamily N-acetyltransferase